MRAVLALLALLAAVPPAAAQELARLDHPAPIAAHGGVVAWSARQADGRFALVTTRGRADVPTRAIPFDVDLGPGPDGRLTAVYSRCEEETPGVGGFAPMDIDEGRGCEIKLHVLGTSEERPVLSTTDADEFWPTIWRDRIAFGRTYDTKPALPYLYVRPVAGGRSIRMPGGPRGADGRSRPSSLELFGRRLAFAWTYQGTGEGLDTEVRLDDVRGREAPRRLDAQAGGGLTGRVLAWPAFAEGVQWSRACYGDQSGCVGQPELRSYAISTGARRGADAPKGIVSHDRDGDATYLLVDEAAGTDCQSDPAVPGGTCVLTRSTPL
jgi:hypothetical protein